MSVGIFYNCAMQLLELSLACHVQKNTFKSIEHFLPVKTRVVGRSQQLQQINDFLVVKSV